jgi:hypothetical protein
MNTQESLQMEFFYKRTSFRTMALYYKQAFKPYYENFKAQNQRSMLEYLALFSHDHMPGLMESLDTNRQIVEYLEVLKLVVFCHRYNKPDEFLALQAIPFCLIRDPMYRYSNKA